MRRATSAVLGTIAGTALLIGARMGTHPAGQNTTIVSGGEDTSAGGAPGTDGVPGTDGATGPDGAPGPGGTASARPGASGSARPTPGPSGTKVTGGPTPTGAPTTTTAPPPPPPGGLKNGSFTGAGTTDKFGTVSVTIPVSGGQVTNLSATYSSSSENISHINGKNAPTVLRQEALTAQSSNIAKVSGATYYSNSYKSSLQSALTKASA